MTRIALGRPGQSVNRYPLSVHKSDLSMRTLLLLLLGSNPDEAESQLKAELKIKKSPHSTEQYHGPSDDVTLPLSPIKILKNESTFAKAIRSSSFHNYETKKLVFADEQGSPLVEVSYRHISSHTTSYESPSHY